MRQNILIHEFTEHIPDDLEDGKIYVSIPYATVVHKCCCGCGSEVVTPLSPTDWKLTFDGKSISLDPSIGNWNSSCRSHYWIKRNKVRWAYEWSDEQIAAGRAQDALAKDEYFGQTKAPADDKPLKPRLTLWQRMKRWF